jgi:tellurite resistance protein
MGLLKTATQANMPEKKATDDVLLMHGMMTMIYGDGQMDEAERQTLIAFLMTVPDFANKDPNELIEEAGKVVRRYPSVRESIVALGDLSNESIRKKCFVLAVDLALASGDVDKEEDEILEAMQRVLNIDDGFARAVIETLSTKYASAA